MSTAKAMGWAALATISGFKASGFQGQIVKAGVKARGMDAISLLPTREQIEAAECHPIRAATFHMHMTWWAEHANIWIKILGQEFKEAVASGDFGEDFFSHPPPGRWWVLEERHWTSSGMQNLTYTEEELAGLREKYSELIAVAQVALMPSCLDALMPTCAHALMASWPHGLMASCAHALMPSCAHASVLSCLHQYFPPCPVASLCNRTLAP